MEDKNKTSIEELIDNYIPNSYGISIDPNLLKQLWDNKNEFNIFYNQLMKKVNNSLSNYVTGSVLVASNITIQSMNNKKYIRISEQTFLDTIIHYLNKHLPRSLYLSLETLSYEEKEYHKNEYINLVKNIIEEKIDSLKQIKNIEDLKDVSFPMYNFFVESIGKSNMIKTQTNAFIINKIKNDLFNKYIENQILKLRKLKRWINEEIEELCRPLDYNLFKNINIDKLKLYIAKQYLEYSKNNDQSQALILLDYVKKSISDISNENTNIKNITFRKGNLKKYQEETIKVYTIKDLKNEFNEYLEQNPELKVKLDKLSDYNKEDFSNLNYNEILEYVDMILDDEEIKKEIEIVEEKDLISELSIINEELEKVNLSNETKNKLNSQKNKLEFLLKECKPHKLCKGIKTFDGYFGYIYPNGMLVLDKLDKDHNKSYGHAIYILHVNKLKEYSGFKLLEIRNKIISGEINDVFRITHDPNGNWKERIKEIIKQESSKTVNEDFEEVELPFDLKELEKINERLSQIQETKSTTILKNKIEKQKQEIIKKSKEIDDTIKKNKSISEINNIEREELKQEEQELSGSIYKTFIELFEKWLKNNKKEKVKRNPVVSLYTKDRARDEQGNYRCELCNCSSFSANDFETHHFIPISKDGPDNIYNTVCLCPNCHTNIHNSKITYNQKYNLLMNIKNNIIKYNPEYLEEFNKFFDEILNIYRKTLDSMKSIEEEKEYYQKHKEQIEELFNIYYIGNNKTK